MKLIPFFNASQIWKSGNFSAPWPKDRLAIHQFVCDQFELGTSFEAELPDTNVLQADDALRFADGARDSLFGAQDANPAPVAKAIVRILNRPDPQRIETLYSLLVRHEVLDLAERVAQLLPSSLPTEHLAMFFEWLARAAPDREPVKFAIAMLGLLPGRRFTPLFIELGRHDEFTIFAQSALLNSLPAKEANTELFALAQQVKGWGRIHLVEYLAPQSSAPFQHWLVREGFRNDVLDQELAYTAAHHGKLFEQLCQDGAGDDVQLLEGAAGILAALCSEFSADETMHDYADGLEAAQKWFTWVETKPVNVSYLYAIGTMSAYARATAGWEAVSGKLQAYLQSGAVQTFIDDLLKGSTGPDRWVARYVSAEAGIDPWIYDLSLQRRDPQADQWLNLMQTQDPVRIDEVIALAIIQMPLDELASDPTLEIGLGSEWREHQNLSMILQSLDQFPGKGWPLIATGLRSPTIRNRNMALRALSAWPYSTWPASAVPLLRHAIEEEPEQNVRERLQNLLRPSQVPD